MCICSLSDACCLLRVNADAMKVQLSYCLHMLDRCPYFIKRATREHKCCTRTMQREARLKTQYVAAERSRAMPVKNPTPSEMYRPPSRTPRGQRTSIQRRVPVQQQSVSTDGCVYQVEAKKANPYGNILVAGRKKKLGGKQGWVARAATHVEAGQKFVVTKRERTAQQDELD